MGSDIRSTATIVGGFHSFRDAVLEALILLRYAVEIYFRPI